MDRRRMSSSIIFLDCDGVLANSRAHCCPQWVEGVDAGKRLSYADDPTLFPHPENAMVPLERPCLEQLARVVRATGADVVLSTSWRLAQGKRAFLVSALAAYGIRVVGDTPDIATTRRGQEVAQWIAENRFVGTFVILDDGHEESFESTALHSKLVLTTMCAPHEPAGEGLTPALADRAIEVLAARR